MKIKAEIAGTRVHDVGYRVLLLEAAEDLELEGFAARNLKQAGVQVIRVLVEGDQPQVMHFREILERERPTKAEVSTIEFEDYDGPVEPIGKYSQRFTGAQLRKGMSSLTSIDEKQDRMLEKQDVTIEILKGVKEDTSAIRVIQDRMLEKQDQMLEKHDQMLEKQDESIEILKAVKDDTSAIREKQDQMLEKQDESVELLKGVKDDTSAIRDEFRQSASSTLEEKYEQLSREIAEIKASISEIKAKVS